MSNNLPKVYANIINEELDNTQKIYYSSTDKNVRVDKKNIISKINNIFKSPNYIYKKDVIIKTQLGEQRQTIIGKSGDNLLTINNQLININDIINIEVVWLYLMGQIMI